MAAQAPGAARQRDNARLILVEGFWIEKATQPAGLARGEPLCGRALLDDEDRDLRQIDHL